MTTAKQRKEQSRRKRTGQSHACRKCTATFCVPSRRESERMKRCRKVGQTALMKHDWLWKKKKKICSFPLRGRLPTVGWRNLSDQF